MTELRPGTSPPPVRMPIRFFAMTTPLLHSHGLSGPLALGFPKPRPWGAAWRGSRCQLFHQSRLAAVANDPGALPKDDCHFRPAPKRRLVGFIRKEGGLHAS